MQNSIHVGPSDRVTQFWILIFSAVWIVPRPASPLVAYVTSNSCYIACLGNRSWSWSVTVVVFCVSINYKSLMEVALSPSSILTEYAIIVNTTFKNHPPCPKSEAWSVSLQCWSSERRTQLRWWGRAPAGTSCPWTGAAGKTCPPLGKVAL